MGDNTERKIENLEDGATRTVLFHNNGRIWKERISYYGETKSITWFNIHGKKVGFHSYKYGKLNGRYCVWSDNGIKKEEGKFCIGKRVGIWEFFDGNGVLKRSLNYNNDHIFFSMFQTAAYFIDKGFFPLKKKA